MKDTEKRVDDEQLSDEERAERAKRLGEECFKKFQARRDSKPNPLATIKEGWTE